MPSKKKAPRKSRAAIQRDALLLRVSMLETRVADLARDLAPTVALRQNLAEQIRLQRKLNALRAEAEKGILEAAPPKRSWWQNWWDALFLSAMNQAVTTVNNAAESITLTKKVR